MTSQQWWDKVKSNNDLFNDWMVKQYRGEVTAAKRIRAIGAKFEVDTKAGRILEEIAAQEEVHADLVLGLLTSRGIFPVVQDAEERYWKETLPAIIDFETAAAVGAHAEKMRLGRIQVIVADVDTPIDVRQVFYTILKDELWHEAAFRNLAGPEAMKATQYSHEQGQALLGLVA